MEDHNMSVKDIADDFTALCKNGNLDEAGRKYWAENVRSIEAMEGPMQVAEGIPALMGKGEWWYGAHDVHSIEVHGPFMNGDQFAVRFVMDVTFKETGVRNTMDEVALYTVVNEKIVEERFFY
jgi:SnoaL-like domain